MRHAPVEEVGSDLHLSLKIARERVHEQGSVGAFLISFAGLISDFHAFHCSVQPLKASRLSRLRRLGGAVRVQLRCRNRCGL